MKKSPFVLPLSSPPLKLKIHEFSTKRIINDTDTDKLEPESEKSSILLSKKEKKKLKKEKKLIKKIKKDIKKEKKRAKKRKFLEMVEKADEKVRNIKIESLSPGKLPGKEDKEKATSRQDSGFVENTQRSRSTSKSTRASMSREMSDTEHEIKVYKPSSTGVDRYKLPSYQEIKERTEVCKNITDAPSEMTYKPPEIRYDQIDFNKSIISSNSVNSSNSITSNMINNIASTTSNPVLVLPVSLQNLPVPVPISLSRESLPPPIEEIKKHEKRPFSNLLYSTSSENNSFESSTASSHQKIYIHPLKYAELRAEKPELYPECPRVLIGEKDIHGDEEEVDLENKLSGDLIKKEADGDCFGWVRLIRFVNQALLSLVLNL